MSNPWTVITIAGLLGFVIGLLGGGGGILAVPLLIAAGQTFLVASSQSLVIVGAAAIAALVPHHRAKRVDWKVGLVFGLARRRRRHRRCAARPDPQPDPAARRADPAAHRRFFTMLRAAAASAAAQRSPPSPTPRWPAAPWPPTCPGRRPSTCTHGVGGRARLVTLASSVGLVTGLLGVGAGFVVVPAARGRDEARRSRRRPPRRSWSSSSTARRGRRAARLPGQPGRHRGLGVAGAAFAVGGALLSRRIAGWILSGAFGGLMILVALYTVVRTVTGG